jgi:hypothetical protein
MLRSKVLGVRVGSWALSLLAFVAVNPASAAVVTFDTVVSGQTSFGFDGDGDGVNDVIFTTTDPDGFNTIGPGLNQSYVHEPGLEGTSELNPDLRVNFLNGASGSIAFGFALNSSVASPSSFASLELFDASNASLGSISVPGAFTSTPGGTSSYPEGRLTLNFSGTAAYGLFNFESQGGRYIIDDFEGVFGSTEPVGEIPEPASVALLGIGLAGLMVKNVTNRRGSRA